MATRLLVRRIWAVSVKDFRRLPAVASLSSSSRPSSLNTSVHTQSFLLPPRSLRLSSHRCISFNVQDHDDFAKRVINSDLPVLVDFYAQYVFSERRRSLSTAPDPHSGRSFSAVNVDGEAAWPVQLHTSQILCD